MEFESDAMQPTPTEARSYGIIPIYSDYNAYNVLVVQNSKGRHWGFPKGTPEGAETPIETAIRELEEETGIKNDDIRIELDGPTFTEEYSFEQEGTRYHKTNTYYIGFVSGITVGNELDEINEAQWVLLSEAKHLLTHKGVHGVADELADYLESLSEHNW